MSDKLFFEINFNQENKKKKNDNQINNIPIRGGGRRVNNKGFRGKSQPNNRGAGLFSGRGRGNGRGRGEIGERRGTGEKRERTFNRRQRRRVKEGRGFGRGARFNLRTVNNSNEHIETQPVITDNLEVELKVNKRKLIKKLEDEELLEKLSLKQLCLKLYVEEYCKYFTYYIFLINFPF